MIIWQYGGFQVIRCPFRRSPVGTLEAHSYLTGQDVHLITLELGSVFISIELSDQSPPLGLLAQPNQLYLIAVSLCQACVEDSGRGGFATLDMIHAVDWAIDSTSQWRTRPPIAMAFLTIMVSGPTGRLYKPGSYDPEIAVAIGATIRKFDASRDGSQPAPSVVRKLEYWEYRSEQMQRGGTDETWWAISPPLDASMNYECDERLGSPASVDCADVEWNQLSPSSDILNIRPGVLFLHSKTCFLAISAAIFLTVTWKQIRVGVAALLNLCNNNPLQAPQGGRAYFQTRPISISGKYKRQAKNVSGLNALPPHLNITIFEQSESWTNPNEELNTCTWKAVSSGKPVTSCNST